VTCCKPLTISQCYAKSLLVAWDSGESPSVETVLGQTALVNQAQLSSSERERFELVHEIGCIMKAWQDSPNRQEETTLTAALSLLRHLAHSRD
jgi:hypothetical protein